MGGLGQLMNMFGGRGGMGGGMGMGVMGGMGGMNRGQSAQQTEQTQTADEYDVDRWQRADGLDNTSAIEQVRADWDKYEQSKKARLPSIFKRRRTGENKTPHGETAQPAAQPSKPAPKPTERAAAPSVPAPAPTVPSPAPTQAAAAAAEDWHSCIGLSTPASIDGFFLQNPLNSTYLAVDTLALGSIMLNQVVQPRAPQPQSRPAESEEGSYMAGVRQGNEQRKYDVHIVD